MKDMIIIDMDLIKELRLNKRYKEAEELIKAYHKNAKKNKRQLINEMRREDRLKKMVKK